MNFNNTMHNNPEKKQKKDKKKLNTRGFRIRKQLLDINSSKQYDQLKPFVIMKLKSLVPNLSI